MSNFTFPPKYRVLKYINGHYGVSIWICLLSTCQISLNHLNTDYWNGHHGVLIWICLIMQYFFLSLLIFFLLWLCLSNLQDFLWFIPLANWPIIMKTVIHCLLLLTEINYFENGNSKFNTEGEVIYFSEW